MRVTIRSGMSMDEPSTADEGVRSSPAPPVPARASSHVALGLVVVTAFAIFLALSPSVTRLGPSLAAAGHGRHWLGAVGGPWWWALPGTSGPVAGPVPPAPGVTAALAAVPAAPGPGPSSGGGITPPGNHGGGGGGTPPPTTGGHGPRHRTLFQRLTPKEQRQLLQAVKGHPRNIPGWLRRYHQRHLG
jgi:hypothetical protein